MTCRRGTMAAEGGRTGSILAVDITWLVPPAVLGFGAVALVVLGRRLGEALDELARSGRRMRRVEDGLIPVRIETRRVRRSIERLPRR